MPGIVAFNRRWRCGSDDFVYPCFVELSVRIIWVIIIAVVFVVHMSSLGCEDGHLVKMYYIGILTIFSLEVVVNIFCVYISAQGTITNAVPRRKLPSLLYIKCVLFVIELLWTVLGTYWAFTRATKCEYHILLTAKIAVVIGWLFFVAVIVVLVVLFDPMRTGSTAEEASNLWETRLRLLCCCANYDEHSKAALTDVSKIFSMFFKDLDVVPTDVAAGLVLLQQEQDRRPHRVHALPCDPAAAYPHPQHWMTVTNAAYYMKYAMASYGWPLYAYDKFPIGCCQLVPYCRCCNFSSYTNVMDDNCCTCNTGTIIKYTGVSESNIVYASFVNKIYEIPYFVALDISNQNVVVSIRGTLSLRDALTDLTADSEEVNVQVDGHVCTAHKGILQTAKALKQSLEEKQLLQKAFQYNPNYTLVITGHSLGAGVAALLSVMLKPIYENLRCFAFSPPGGLLSRGLSRYTEDFILSVVLGEDLVPRLSVVAMENMKKDVIRLVRACSQPKYRVLAGGCWRAAAALLCHDSARPSDGARQRLLGDTNSSSPCYNTAGLEAAVDDCIVRCGRPAITQDRLLPPGHVLYLQEEEPCRALCGEPAYSPVWVRAEALDEVLVSPRMVTDHLPDAVQRALTQVQRRGLQPRFLLHVDTLTEDSADGILTDLIS